MILKGVRQVGKTWILKEFGKLYYENTAYFNFDENEEYRQFFETTKDVDRILQNLMLASGQEIVPEKAFNTMKICRMSFLENCIAAKMKTAVIFILARMESTAVLYFLRNGNKLHKKRPLTVLNVKSAIFQMFMSLTDLFSYKAD